MDGTLSIDMRDLRALVARSLHERMLARARDLRPAWEAVLERIYATEQALFAAEGRTDEHSEWPPLKNGGKKFHEGLGYAEWKALHFPGRKKLRLTGKLEGQLTGEGGAHVERRADKLVFGTDYETITDVPGRPRSQRDRMTGDLGGIAAEGRQDYYPMEPRPPIRLDAASAAFIAEPIVDHLLR